MTGPFGKFEKQRASARIVALSRKDVEEAERLLKLLKEAPDPGLLETVGETSRAVTSQDVLASAWRELSERRRRYAHFPEAMFGEPAWDILLLLYIERDNNRLNIGRLAERLGMPQSSTGRWVNYLQDRKLAQRNPHPTDQRTVFVEITEEGTRNIEAYYSGTPPLGQ